MGSKYAWSEPKSIKDINVGTPVQIRWHDGVRRGVVTNFNGSWIGVRLVNQSTMSVTLKQIFYLASTFDREAYCPDDPEEWLRMAKERGLR